LAKSKPPQFALVSALPLKNWQVRDKKFPASRKNTASKFVHRGARTLAQYRRERCSIVVVVVEI